MKEIYEEIGQRIRKLRKSRHLTQSQLAEKVKMSRPSISLIESGKQKTSIKRLYLFNTALECSIYLLLPPLSNKQWSKL